MIHVVEPAAARALLPAASKGHELTIRQHYSYLVESLQVQWSTLVEAAIIATEDSQCIDTEQSLYARNITLLQILARKSETEFNKFVDLLVSTGQRHIRDYLTYARGQYSNISCAMQGRTQEGADGAKAPPEIPRKNYLLIQIRSILYVSQFVQRSHFHNHFITIICRLSTKMLNC